MSTITGVEGAAFFWFSSKTRPHAAGQRKEKKKVNVYNLSTDTVLASGSEISYFLKSTKIGKFIIYRFMEPKVKESKFSYISKIFVFLYHKMEFRTKGYVIPYLLSTEIRTNLEITHTQVC